jgi:hypothetical protein
MAKVFWLNYRFTVLLLNSDDVVIGGLASVHDLEKTKRLALSALHLDGRFALAAIHNYAAHAAELENCEPVARLSLDDAVED